MAETFIQHARFQTSLCNITSINVMFFMCISSSVLVTPQIWSFVKSHGNFSKLLLLTKTWVTIIMVKIKSSFTFTWRYVQFELNNIPPLLKEGALMSVCWFSLNLLYKNIRIHLCSSSL